VTAGFVFKLGSYRASFYQLSLCYDEETRLTYGLLLTKSNTYSPVATRLLSSLYELKSCCDQPMLLALLSSEQVTDDCNERIRASEKKLSDLEETMGQHEYKDRPKGNPLNINFLATTSALNHISKRLAVDVCELGSVLIALEKISDWKKEITENREEHRKAGNAMVAENGYRMVEERITYLTDYCRVLGLEAEYEDKRTRSLIQVVRTHLLRLQIDAYNTQVYQFMAQRDAKVNIELAKNSAILASESKKDSSVMKTIAILGMLFLPGTFVAVS
jgi:Mg2+ and Co2+ transporter CorA